jgi:predicted RNA-binding protein with PIN domain
MPYLIDGHNLIPKVRGLSLGAEDDEMQLIRLLQEFCRLSRKEVEVHFDNAPAGQPRARTYGTILARFARTGQTADQTIHDQLTRLGRTARNWTVVSSDHSVQNSARAARAQVLPSEDFASLLMRTLHSQGQAGKPPADTHLSSEEVDDWLDIFGARDE